jgi:hypothetical protein
MANLDGVRLKIARADEHYESFKHELGDFLRSEPYSFRSELDPQSGEKIWRVYGQPKAPPLHLAAIAGDMLQNLRSALDHLAVQLVLANGQQPTRATAFPIFEDAARFEGQTGQRKLRGMNAAAIARIQDLQPCYGRNPYRSRMLLLLEDLNNIDKHRHLHLITITGTGGLWAPDGIPRAETRWFIYQGPIEEGTILARLAGEYVDVNFAPAHDVAFADAPPLSIPGTLVAYVLIGIRDLVERIVNDFEPLV